MVDILIIIMCGLWWLIILSMCNYYFSPVSFKRLTLSHFNSTYTTTTPAGVEVGVLHSTAL